MPPPSVFAVARSGLKLLFRLCRESAVPRRTHFHERATVIDHLEELRHRMLVCLLAFAPAFVVCWSLHGRIITALTTPLPGDVGMPVTFGVAEPFMLSMRISAIAALGLVLPLMLWHVWAYCAPACAPDAQRSVRWFGLSGIVLFALGVTFAYLVALPGALAFLTHFDKHLYHVQLRALDYYNFIALSLLAIGMVFELPVVVLGLVRFRILSAETLRTNRRTGYALVAVLAVVLPGVDPVMTGIEALPLLVLYEATVVIARHAERRWEAARELADRPVEHSDEGRMHSAA